jgi:hypothetical protein
MSNACDTNPLTKMPILLQLIVLAVFRSGIDKRRKLISNTRFQIQTILAF